MGNIGGSTTRTVVKAAVYRVARDRARIDRAIARPILSDDESIPVPSDLAPGERISNKSGRSSTGAGGEIFRFYGPVPARGDPCSLEINVLRTSGHSL